MEPLEVRLAVPLLIFVTQGDAFFMSLLFTCAIIGCQLHFMDMQLAETGRGTSPVVGT